MTVKLVATALLIQKSQMKPMTQPRTLSPTGWWIGRIPVRGNTTCSWLMTMKWIRSQMIAPNWWRFVNSRTVTVPQIIMGTTHMEMRSAWLELQLVGDFFMHNVVLLHDWLTSITERQSILFWESTKPVQETFEQTENFSGHLALRFLLTLGSWPENTLNFNCKENKKGREGRDKKGESACAGWLAILPPLHCYFD